MPQSGRRPSIKLESRSGRRRLPLFVVGARKSVFDFLDIASLLRR